MILHCSAGHSVGIDEDLDFDVYPGRRCGILINIGTEGEPVWRRCRRILYTKPVPVVQRDVKGPSALAEGDRWITMEEAMDILGLSRDRVRGLATAGEIVGHQSPLRRRWTHFSLASGEAHQAYRDSLGSRMAVIAREQHRRWLIAHHKCTRCEMELGPDGRCAPCEAELSGVPYFIYRDDSSVPSSFEHRGTVHGDGSWSTSC